MRCSPRLSIPGSAPSSSSIDLSISRSSQRFTLAILLSADLTGAAHFRCVSGFGSADWAAMGDGALAHPEVAQSAARRYVAHLNAVEAAAESSSVRTALRRLIETTESAERLGPRLELADVAFRFSSLQKLDIDEWGPFLNEFQLGLGYDGAPILAIGTETAGDPADPEGTAWDCLQTALILSGSPHGVVEGLLRESSWWAEMEADGVPPDLWRPFHVHPNDLYQVQRHASTGTWINLAKLVLPSGEGLETIIGQGAEPGLGGLVYQIERSALPAKTSSGGKVPTRERTDWLVREVIPALRQTAHTLLIHGFGNGKAWDANGLELISTFLGYEPGTLTRLEWGPAPAKRGDWLWSRAEGKHRVVWTRALGWRWRGEYMAAAREALVR